MKGGVRTEHLSAEHQARFAARVEKTETCWLWRGLLRPDGYGLFHAGPRAIRRGYLAHRYAYVVAGGAIPPEMQIHHICEVRACVRANHLELVEASLHNLLRHPDSVAARNAAKVVCLRGHPFDERNTVVRRNGTRFCRACNRMRQEERRKVPRRVDSAHGRQATAGRHGIVTPPSSTAVHG